MSPLESLQLEHLPPSHNLHIALYRNVKNASFLHQQLLAGNTAFEYALIDASVIISKVHILAAVYRAVNDLLSDKLKTRNVHAEIVFALSPNNNIAESFRRFGIAPTTTSLIVIKVSTPTSPLTTSEIQAHLDTSIEGEAIPFSDEALSDMTDLARVKKIYKLNSGSGAGGKKRAANTGLEGEGEAKGEDRGELEVAILGAMALRGVTN